MNFAVFNSRSLAPKIKYLTEFFEENDLALAVISETWLIEGPILEDLKQELSNGYGLHIIYTNRRAKKGRNTGGGVCIVFRKSQICLKQYAFSRDGCEFIAAKGKLKGDTRTFFVIGTYIPPNLTKRQQEAYKDVLHNLMSKIKIEEKEPHIILAGDTNRLDLSEVTDDFLNFNRINTPPTRAGQFLDEIYSTLKNPVIKCSSQPPLQNEDGGESDHLTLICELDVPRSHVFTYVTYHAREMKKADKEQFVRAYTNINWQAALGDVQCPDEMTKKKLHELTDRLNDLYFPMKK